MTTTPRRGRKRRPPVDYDRLAQTFQALTDVTRLRILTLLEQAPDGEMAVVDIIDALSSLSQPTISYHLKTLYNASPDGLVIRRVAGRLHYYRINRAAFDVLTATLPTTVP